MDRGELMGWRITTVDNLNRKYTVNRNTGEALEVSVPKDADIHEHIAGSCEAFDNKNMIKQFLLLFVTLFSLNAHSEEVGLRLSSAISAKDNSVVQFPSGSSGPNDLEYQGKMINLFYDHDFTQNFYLEGAIGYRSYSDIFEYSSTDFEVSPGFKVTAGYFVLKLSEGISYMPENNFDPATFVGYRKVDFVTHLTLGLKDPSTGWAVYLDRSHYSNGYAENNPSLNYAGFMVSKSF